MTRARRSIVDDVVDRLGLERLSCSRTSGRPGRSASSRIGSIRARRARRDSKGSEPPRILEAEPGRPTVEAVRQELHDLSSREASGLGVVVLSGSRRRRARSGGSAVRQHQLWNRASMTPEDTSGCRGGRARRAGRRRGRPVRDRAAVQGARAAVVILAASSPRRAIGWTSSVYGLYPGDDAARRDRAATDGAAAAAPGRQGRPPGSGVDRLLVRDRADAGQRRQDEQQDRDRHPGPADGDPPRTPITPATAGRQRAPRSGRRSRARTPRASR